MVNGSAPIDFTGLNRRDILDIERDMKKQRERLEKDGLDADAINCMMNAIHHALVVCKKINKKKYTPKKYRKSPN